MKKKTKKKKGITKKIINPNLSFQILSPKKSKNTTSRRYTTLIPILSQLWGNITRPAESCIDLLS
jgi:hypothetical protein